MNVNNKDEQADKECIRKWLEIHVPRIRDDREFIKLEGDKKFLEDLKKGIPSEIRGLVWTELIGNELRITSKLY